MGMAHHVAKVCAFSANSTLSHLRTSLPNKHNIVLTQNFSYVITIQFKMQELCEKDFCVMSKLVGASTSNHNVLSLV